MRTTVDIPDELLRRAKSEAALQGRKLKDLIEEGLRRLLEQPPTPVEVEKKAGKDKPRPGSLHELLFDMCGIMDDGPTDLSTNPKHFKGFGE